MKTKSFPSQKEKGALLSPYVPHSYFTTGKKWTTAYLTFGGESVESIIRSLKLNQSAVYTESNQAPNSTLLLSLINKVEDKKSFSHLDLMEDVFKMLIQMKKSNRTSNEDSSSQYYGKIQPIVSWIEENYMNNIGSHELSEQAGVSQQYLSTMFQSSFNMSPYSFLIQFRIKEAKKKVDITEGTIPKKNIGACRV